ncbi:MAG: (2Fe-2S)-binding protein [Candidatus Marinimicrobia bacterium]|nr:(2Fe-2S)-binding protein [Candidatus Neomarinimicrobiota bacterium]
MYKYNITLEVNGIKYSKTVDSRKLLLNFIREDLHLTGTKEACGEGECGSCTIIMDGKALNSCLILAVEADTAKITTIEGLEINGELDTIQQGFVDEHGVQCGFCIPGFIMTARAALNSNPDLKNSEIRSVVAGNLCRCTGYVKIFKSIEKALRLEKRR